MTGLATIPFVSLMVGTSNNTFVFVKALRFMRLAQARTFSKRFTITFSSSASLADAGQSGSSCVTRFLAVRSWCLFKVMEEKTMNFLSGLAAGWSSRGFGARVTG